MGARKFWETTRVFERFGRADEQILRAAQLLREKRRRGLGASGQPFIEPPPLLPPDYDGPPLGMAEMLLLVRKQKAGAECGEDSRAVMKSVPTRLKRLEHARIVEQGNRVQVLFRIVAGVDCEPLHSEAEPPLIGRRQHGTSRTDRCGGTLWRGGSGSTMTRMHRATGEALLVPSRNRRSRNPYNRRHREVGGKARG